MIIIKNEIKKIIESYSIWILLLIFIIFNFITINGFRKDFTIYGDINVQEEVKKTSEVAKTCGIEVNEQFKNIFKQNYGNYNSIFIF